MSWRVLGVLALTVLLPAGIAETLTVAASIAPVCNLVKEVGKDRVTVVQLIPNGANPHTYEPTPLEVYRATQAEAFFLVGLGLDAFLEKTIHAASGKAPIFCVSSGIPLLEELQRDHKAANPHVWLSLRNARIILENIAEALSSLDPAGETFYRKNAREYIAVLEELDEWFEKEVQSLTSRAFVATHAFLSYLARDYGLKEAGILEKNPGYEPSPQELGKLITLMKTENVRVIVFEPQSTVKAAEILAQETGSLLLPFDPLGSFPDTPYHELMRKNLESLAKALREERP